MSLLPKELDYLEAAAFALAKIPPNELDESVDVPALEAALQRRVTGLKPQEAVRIIADDCSRFERWLDEIGDGQREAWTYWLQGFLVQVGPLAEHLSSPLPPPRLPQSKVSMELPKGWKSKSPGFAVDNDGLCCAVILLDQFSYEVLQVQNHQREIRQQRPDYPSDLGLWSRSNITLDPCCGQKYQYTQSGRVNWKGVDYLLKVPGGYVSVQLSRQNGETFDEAEIEGSLHTLKVVAPG